jgi:hypothetical protein
MVTENKQFEREFLCYSMDFLAVQDKTKNAKVLNGSDKIIMPEAILDHLHRYPNIMSPYMFRLKNKDKVGYCGVLEFTSDSPHVVYVPKWLMVNLGLMDGDRFEILSVNLQKGEMISLRPKTEMFFKLSNPKSVLENHLKRFTVLYQGETLRLDYLGKSFEIDVAETSPDRAIDITDIDLKLQFINIFDKTKEEEADKPDYWSKAGPGKK